MNELCWAGGLFEGEGCFTLMRGTAPRAALTMNDEDVVRRFCAAVGIGKVYGPYGPYLGHGNFQRWEWKADGLEKVQAVVAMLWNGLGQRRRSRAAEVLREGGHK
jgi:hypothetical protein